MISFKTFFRQRMARSFTLLFAVMLLLANLTVYLVSGIQYGRQTERQETSFVEMMRHMILWEDDATLIAFIEHYGHTHGVALVYADAGGNILYATEEVPDDATSIPIETDDGTLLGTLTIGYEQSFFGTELIWGLAFVNGFSALLFVIAMLLLRRYLNAQYSLLHEDMVRIGRTDEAFRFSDMEDINARYTAALKAESDMKAMQAHYIRIIAHDVKTPLTVMKAYLEGVRSGRIAFDAEVNDELLEGIAAIEQMIPRFIAQDLRQVAIRQNIAPLVRSHLDKLGEVFLTKQTNLVTHLEDLDVTIAAEDLIRILEHLAFNAFYYSEPGGTITVGINAAARRMTVEDTGIGMNEDTLSRIRSGAYRDAQAVKYNQKGSGIGYQIVFDIAKRIGAVIEIDSVPGTGTKVIVWFDRRQTIDPNLETQ